MESVSMSETALMRTAYWRYVPCSRQSSGVRISPGICSCKVEGGRALSSKSVHFWKSPSASTADSGLMRDGNSTRHERLLHAYDDEYGGVVVDPERLPSDPSTFVSVLRSSLSHWRRKERKGVWLKLPVERSELVPVAIKEGFEYHHAEKGYVMLTHWIPEGPSMLPANASHQVGVGGFVVNDHKEVLVVQEKYCAPALSGLWKLPTGFIHESEEIFSGAMREVKEETGIDTEFVEVIAFRHAHNVAFQKSDLFFICMLRPLSTKIIVDHLEIHDAKWMALEEFVEQPVTRGDKMLKRVNEICMARLGRRYCGLSAHRLVSALEGKPASLYYNVVDHNDSCLGN
ncbi:PREDICTED: nudix hydrolase 8 [Tarenaya hassleriana]|uniref:nudix hydrolase 8 n=1 Tax=Tarenaya hassleriana TaxID=28532 RepID=UPI00053C3C31|nr:PREDICTED: nudix hydrolase 8 [Tarenaya hassleriana]XP_019056231.1 PREDICTED: nudix hydrolase 8 [Tarenaya hassleriana]